jgi:hypothetical protein
MTGKVSEEIVDVLNKCDTTRVFTLDAFNHVVEGTHFSNAIFPVALFLSMHNTIFEHQ